MTRINFFILVHKGLNNVTLCVAQNETSFLCVSKCQQPVFVRTENKRTTNTLVLVLVVVLLFPSYKFQELAGIVDFGFRRDILVIYIKAISKLNDLGVNRNATSVHAGSSIILGIGRSVHAHDYYRELAQVPKYPFCRTV